MPGRAAPVHGLAVVGAAQHVDLAVAVGDRVVARFVGRSREIDGRLVDDFVITGTDRVVVVRNAPSPGATSSLAIAAHVVDQVLG